MGTTGPRGLAGVLLVVSVWAMAVPYVGPLIGLEVGVAPSVEVVDHLVPGVLLVAVALAGLVTRTLPLASALAAVLASVWMVATHLPLLDAALSGRVAFPAALWHAVPAVVLLAVAAAAAVKSARG